MELSLILFYGMLIFISAYLMVRDILKRNEQIGIEEVLAIAFVSLIPLGSTLVIGISIFRWFKKRKNRVSK